MKRFSYLLFFLGSFSIQSFSSNILEVQAIDSHILVIHFDDGYIRYHGYHETGQNDSIFQSPLDLKKSKSLLSYQLFSDDDLHFSQGWNPILVGRKSKPTKFAFKKEKDVYPVVMEHWIYLKFTFPLQENSTYTLKLEGLAENFNEWKFNFNTKELLSPAIHVNQLGFTPDSEKKLAYISHWMGDLGGLESESIEQRTFHLMRTSDQKFVFDGKVKRFSNFETALPDVPIDQSLRGSISGADIWECDFSAYKKEGEYKIVVDGMGCSYTFEIDPDIYRDAFYYACRGLYHQRSGIELKAQFTQWVRPADHNPQITPEYFGATTKHKVYLTSVRNLDLTDETGFNQKENILKNIIDTLDNCWGFYHDAGDWDGYSSHIRVPRELLMAYELAPTNFSDNELNIPESGNGIPDILDEARWLIDHYKRNVGKTGGIFGGRIHTEFNKGFPGIGMGIPSWEDPGFTIVTGEDPQISYDFAAVAMEYVWNLKKQPEKVSPAILKTLKSYEVAAMSAYEWAEKNTLPKDVDKVTPSKATADVWFYKMTGKKVYQEDFAHLFTENVKDYRSLNEYGWVWALYAYGLIPENFKGLNQELWSNVRTMLVDYARLKVTDAIDANRSFRAGGNPTAAALQGSATIPYGMPALVAWKITGDKKFYQAAQTSSDYALGGNPLNILWLTGMGDNPPKQIMNLDSYYDQMDDPIPGIAPYGPSHRCDWMSQPNDNCKGSGPWDNDFALDQVYPNSELWPVHEFWFEGLYCPPAAEYTVHQTVAPSAAVYGVLCQPKGTRKANVAPIASIIKKEKTDQSGMVFEVNAIDTDGKIDHVDFFVDHQFRASEQKAPYLIEVPVSEGKHPKIEARVFDNKGAKTVVRK